MPAGIHNATLEEVGAVFGKFEWSDRRVTLFQRLCEYIAELRSARHATEIRLDGSFVSAKASPGDIDLIVVYPSGFNFSAAFTPAEYNTIDRRRVRRLYGFDIAPVTNESPDLELWTAYFSTDLRIGSLTKGLVRVRL